MPGGGAVVVDGNDCWVDTLVISALPFGTATDCRVEREAGAAMIDIIAPCWTIAKAATGQLH